MTYPVVNLRGAHLSQIDEDQSLRELARDAQQRYLCTKEFGFDAAFAETVEDKIISGEALTTSESNFLNRLHTCLTGVSKQQAARMIGETEDKLRARPDCDPDGTVTAAFDRAKRWLESARPGDSFQARTDEQVAVSRFNACFEREPTGVSMDEGIPTWAWVAGGVVGVGLVAFLATR